MFLEYTRKGETTSVFMQVYSKVKVSKNERFMIKKKAKTISL